MATMIDHYVDLARAVADPNRLRLLALLTSADREVCVCEIMEILDLPQSRVSRHLQMLRRLKLVRDRREGKWVHYRLDPQVTGGRDLLRLVRAWAKACPELAADRTQLDRVRQSGKLASCKEGRRRLAVPVRKVGVR
jgi:DNA-binding transcriptional ArsR family regulator